MIKPGIPTRIKAFLLELFSILSRLLNVLTGGTADMTFSARSHIEGLWTEGLIDWVAQALFGERQHCRLWWFREVIRSEQNIIRHNKNQTEGN